MCVVIFQSFKRRYFYLKQQADTTYVLEFHKDDRKLEAKGAIFLDSAKDVIRVSNSWKYSLVITKLYTVICWFV